MVSLRILMTSSAPQNDRGMSLRAYVGFLCFDRCMLQRKEKFAFYPYLNFVDRDFVDRLPHVLRIVGGCINRALVISLSSFVLLKQ